MSAKVDQLKGGGVGEECRNDEIFVTEEQTNAYLAAKVRERERERETKEETSKARWWVGEKKEGRKEGGSLRERMRREENQVLPTVTATGPATCPGRRPPATLQVCVV